MVLESLPAGVFLGMSAPDGRQLVSFTVRTSASIQFRVRSTLCIRHVLLEKRVRPFIVLFNSPFFVVTNRIFFIGTASNLPSTFSVFVQHVFVRHLPKFFWCCRW